MQSDAIVENLYVFKYRQVCICSASVTGTEDQLSFQGSKKRFNAGIVIAVTFLIPAMEKSGYTRSFSAAITATTATVGPIIPPSVAFVLFGAASGISIGSLFIAGFLPGIIMGILIVILVYIITIKHNFPCAKKVSLLIFLGLFIATAALIILLVPILMPIIEVSGIDPLHFGVVFIVSLMIGTITPPFGVLIFITCRIENVNYGEFFKEMVPFYTVALIL